MNRIHLKPFERIPDTRLRYIKDVERVNPTRRNALFVCDCGKEITRDLHWVRFLNITSCGCYKTESVSEKNTKHNHAVRFKQSGAYRSWQAMNQRTKSDPCYANVEVCERWKGDRGFINFIEDMGDRPDGYSIERIDNQGNYEPGNCKWATRLEQQQNTRGTKLITLDSETHSINEWCRIYKIGYHVYKQRIRRGMSVESAIKTPLDKSKQGRKKGNNE